MDRPKAFVNLIADHPGSQPDREKVVWTAEQVRQIVLAVPSEYRAMFTYVALTGVRLGELLAVKWKYVDFDNCVLHIRQSLWDGELETPKTLAGLRNIPFGEG